MPIESSSGSEIVRIREIGENIIGVNEGNSIIIPDDFVLYPAYPNPFNPVTNIRYTLPERSDVTLVIYNVVGEEIQRFSDKNKHPGNHEFEWDAGGLASGIYFYTLQSADFIQTKKMLLLK